MEAPVDLETLEQLREVMEDEFEDLLQTYLEVAPKELDRIAHALRILDGDILASSAHTLKGSSSNLGAHRLAVMCNTLIDLGKTGQFDEETIRLVGSLNDEYDRVREVFLSHLNRT